MERVFVVEGCDMFDDDTFDALANAYRRQLLLELRDGPQYVSEPSELCRDLDHAHEELLREHLSSSREVREADEELVRQHFVHLPKLDAYGYIELNRDDTLVTQGPRFDELRPLLELLADGRDDRSTAEPVLTLRR